MPDSTNQGVLSLAEAARRAGRSIGTMRTACKFLGLRHYFVAGRIVVHEGDLGEWLLRPDVAARRELGDRIRKWTQPGAKPDAATA